MSIKSRLQKVIRTIELIPQQVIRYIASAATRIFSPTDDNYPETGVQPFEGDPADKKSF
ncbi:MAG: hypothetical protein HC833_14740 [Leptolyngbyaceae cyanobacterium RM1_406_9]|nr:hypothetical protein [Leptolyngbyaceae cyanobacterium RM1_406_9]